jgi:hypothetical protein
MLRNVGALVILVAVSTSALNAAGQDLPEIMTGSGNAVPQCVTPGRLMVFLRQRNPELNPRYDGIATQYMRFGEQLGVRWDFAFYQMIVETGALRYTGDVKPDQNNFAGLGATGHGERGESFKSIEAGVRAHIEHILLYAGHPVASPVADRTRKVHEWGTLVSWQQGFKRPISYADLGTKWSGNRSYSAMLQTVAERFQSDVCRTPDPRPELVREARALVLEGTSGAAKAAETTPALSPGEELAQRAIAQAKADGTGVRSSLGGEPSEQAVATPAGSTKQTAATTASTVPYKVPGISGSEAQKVAAVPAKAPTIESKPAVEGKVAAPAKAGPGSGGTGTGPVGAGAGAVSGGTRLALAGVAAPSAKAVVDTAVPPAANQKCRVWTASYGGQKSIIIRHVSDQVVNFTVLDVNSGAEGREADAFIAAYAKNGKMIAGAYENQALALDKAFELCPEG